MLNSSKIIIVGAGPAGLFAAYFLLKKGHAVDIYDHSGGAAKKFLIAGNGGLNLTHSENLDAFASRYGKDEKRFRSLLEEFSPDDLRNWLTEMGTETFVGTSGRVFPKEMSAGKVLLNWLDHLKSYERFDIFLKHRLVGMTKEKELTFDNEGQEKKVKADRIIFALGGGSWKKTGSDGSWVQIVESLGVKVKPLLPMNCGFERAWSDYFINSVDRAPVKHVEVSFSDKTAKGDLMLTPYGVEGGVIYALSNHIRNKILEDGHCKISIDLLPNLSIEKIIEKLAGRPKKATLSNYLRKSLKIEKTTFTLLKEVLKSTDFETPKLLAKKIKSLEIELNGIRPIDEAISTSGGICFTGLTGSMESRTIPGLYFAGEMLDYEAPTGGYLLQGCFSTAWAISKDF